MSFRSWGLAFVVTAGIAYTGLYFAALGPKEAIAPKVVELHITFAATPDDTKSTSDPRIKPVAGKGICSGLFIDDEGTILTARHCTEGVDHMDVLTSDHSVYAASFVAKSNLHDLALIRVDRKNTPYFTLAQNVQQGENVNVLGNPMGETDVLSRGIIAKTAGDIVVVDCSVVPGNSGGPAYNDRGELVGVATAVFVSAYGMTHLGVLQAPDAIRAFLKETIWRKHA